MSLADTPGYTWHHEGGSSTWRRRLVGHPTVFKPTNNEWLGPRPSIVVGVTLTFDFDAHRDDVKRAWIATRFRHPTIAATFCNAEPPILEYVSPVAAREAEDWAESSIVSHDATPQTLIDLFEDVIGGRHPHTDAYIALHHFPKDGEARTIRLFVVASHALVDIYGTNLVLHSFLQHLVRPPNPDHLNWGAEGVRLSLPVAALGGRRNDGHILTEHEVSVRDRIINNESNGPQHYFGLAAFPPPDPLPDDPLALVNCFLRWSRPDTQRLIEAAKALRMGVGEVVLHTTMIAAYRATCSLYTQAGLSLPTGEEAETTGLGTIIPGDQRRFLPPDLRDQALYGVGVGVGLSARTGFVEASDACRRFEADIADGKLPPRPFLPSIAEMIAVARSEASLPVVDIDIIDPVAAGLAKRAPPEKRASMWVLSILGELSPYISSRYEHDARSLCVADYVTGTIAIEPWPVVRAWTFDGSFQVHVSGNKRILDPNTIPVLSQEIQRCLRTVAGLEQTVVPVTSTTRR